MKKILLTMIIIVSVIVPVMAQHAYTYRFASTPFISSPSGGPTLETIDSTFTPVSVMLPVTTCPDTPVISLTHFAQNAGFRAKAFFSHTYSIEMIFKFDILNGYDRIIDFSNSLSDVGIYTLSDCLNFYPSGDIGTCPGAFDTTNYKQIVFTRDSATQSMNIYVNGSLFTNYIDAADYYVIQSAPNDSIKFFRDDNVVPNEASSGNVALITLADYEYTLTEVTNSYNDFCNRLNGIDELKGISEFNFFPNPTTGKFKISCTSPVSTIEIYNVLGNKVYSTSGLSHQTENEIDLSDFSKGIYLAKIYSATRIFSRKIIVM